jgi:outer membrane protein assembly factor BamA
VAIYYSGLKNFDKNKYIRKKEEKVAKIDRKIAAQSETRTKKINNLEFKKQKVGSRFDKKIELGNNRMQWGEPIAVLDTALVRNTVERFRNYLFAEGYFRNSVSYSIDSVEKRMARVEYHLVPGRAYFIDTVMYNIADSTLKNLIVGFGNESTLKRGERYRQDNLTKERERIDLVMKDNGYYEFSRQYVVFDVDTAFHKNRRVAIRITVLDPAEKESHKRYKLTAVNFISNPSRGADSLRREQAYHGINFRLYQNRYSLRILSQRIFLQPGDYFSKTRTFDTQRQLANLNVFKFVNVNYDTTGGNFVANIYTNPLDKNEISTEAGVSVTQGFPGPFLNVNFKKRNIFRGLELFDVTGYFGFEGVASATDDQNIYKSTEAGVNASITFPQILFPLGHKRLSTLGRYNPKTRFQVGYSYTDRPEYRRTFTSMSGTYLFQNQRTTQYSFTFLNVSVIDTLNISSSFKDFLEEQAEAGNFSLLNSFYPSFVTSMSFGITWNPDNYGNKERNSMYIRGLFESGGTLWNFVDPKWIREDSLQIFQFLRFSFDYRKSIVINRNTWLAYRINSGVVIPYGSDGGIPYEKFFFAGGSNSVRAWRPRRLGPGSYKPNFNPEEEQADDGLFDYSIEKPAPILIEGSVELRKKIVGFLDGALFVDVGNVWTIEPWEKKVNDEVVENGNSQFKLDEFYKEFGVGTGFGFRFDFAFLILRFDVGIKVYDPARDPGDRFVLSRARFFKPFDNGREPVIYNIGINYPF